MWSHPSGYIHSCLKSQCRPSNDALDYVTGGSSLESWMMGSFGHRFYAVVAGLILSVTLVSPSLI